MKGDFTGFSFDGVHSSELNLYRVSDGDRYEEQILPELEDRTIEVPGANRGYYFGSDWKPRTFTIQLAFDSVTEAQYRNIRRLFGQKSICPLIFDERPYKVYMAKIESPISLETICFDEPVKFDDDPRNGVRHINRTEQNPAGEWETVYPYTYRTDELTGKTKTQRIYKGEGSIDFILYEPFAHQLYKTLDQYHDLDIYSIYQSRETLDPESDIDLIQKEINDWAPSSLLLSQQEFDSNLIDRFQLMPVVNEHTGINYSEAYNGQFNVYNAGDIDTPYSLFLPYADEIPVVIPSDGDDAPMVGLVSGIAPESGDYVKILTDGYGELVIKPFERDTSIDPDNLMEENGVIIDTRAQLIQGVHFDYTTKTWKLTGTLYNNYIKSGTFGKIMNGNNFDSRWAGVYLNFKTETQEEIVEEDDGEGGSTIRTVTSPTIKCPYIFYNYWYF